MALQDDQTAATDSDLLGRFIAAVKSVAAGIVEEPTDTKNHAARMALVKRIMLERQAENFGRVILELAIARQAAVRASREKVTDDDIMSCVAKYIDTFAAQGW